MLYGQKEFFGSGAGLCVLPGFLFDFAYFSGGDPASAGLKRKAEAEAGWKNCGESLRTRSSQWHQGLNAGVFGGEMRLR